MATATAGCSSESDKKNEEEYREQEAQEETPIRRGSSATTAEDPSRLPSSETPDDTGARLAQMMEKLTMLTETVQTLKTEVKRKSDERKKPSERQDAPTPPEEYKLTTLDEDEPGEMDAECKHLYRLSKIIKTKELDPASEEEMEDVLDEWEERTKGSGLPLRALKQLALYLGSPRVTFVLKRPMFPSLTWVGFKDALGRALFPHSTYVVDLEEEIIRESRGAPLDKAVAKLTKQLDRHQRLCVRWQRKNFMEDDRKKEALLKKIPPRLMAACFSVADRREMSFQRFIDHCLLVEAGENVRAKIMEAGRHGPPVAALEAPEEETFSGMTAAPSSSSRVPPPSTGKRLRDGPMDIYCYRCGEKGHMRKNCPQLRPRCATCGRLGHRTETCFRKEYKGPYGKTRTGTMRMTKGGVRLDVVEEVSKRTFLEAMREFLQAQEAKYDRLKEQTAQRRQRQEEGGVRGARSGGEGEEGEEEGNEGDQEEGPIRRRRIAAALELYEAIGEEGAVPLRYVELTIFRRRIPFLVDTGAAVSLLPKPLWDSFTEEERAGTSRAMNTTWNVRGLGGALKVVDAVDLPLLINGRGYSQRFLILEDIYYPILGFDALASLEVRIDCAKREVRMKGQPVPLPEPPALAPTPLCCHVFGAPTLKDLRMGQGAPDEERGEVEKLLSKMPSAWQHPKPGSCRMGSHRIDVGTARPVAQRVRRLAPPQRAALDGLMKELVEAGVIRESRSPWAAPIVLVPKPGGEVRLCIDYRALNKVTRQDMYPLPCITELLHRLGGATRFTTLDLASGFYQVPMHPSSVELTAFVCPLGLYEFTVMPFGLTNAPRTFQRIMDRVFRGFRHPSNVGVYLDDIVVYTTKDENHLAVLEEVLRVLTNAGLAVNVKKSFFLGRRVKYLGFIIEQGEMRPDPEQIQALDALQPPSSPTGVRRFLGFAGYFRHFIQDFARKARPISRLLKKGIPFRWTAESHTAWTLLKRELSGPEVRLMLPVEGRPYTLDTDASAEAVGAVLLQEGTDGLRRPVAYASRALTPTESRWTTREQEAFAVVWGVLRFAPYLRHQSHFLVRTDHQSLRWLWRTENKRVARWALLLQEYNFAIEHQRGDHHHHADVFSRDVRATPGDSAIEERICARPLVYATIAATTSERCAFPTTEEIRAAQAAGCSEDFAREHRLRRPESGLWESQGGRIYIPPCLQERMLYFFHFGKGGAHQGINQTCRRVGRVFWWPAMKETVQEYNKKCLTCTRRHGPPAVTNRGHLISPTIGQVVAIDLLGPLSLRGVKDVTILTMMDHFSRMPHAEVISPVTAAQAWRLFRDGWICQWGAPRHLLSDNGSVFRGREFHQECVAAGIKKVYAMPYHPQSNGILESFHGILKKGLFSRVRLTSESLPEILTILLMAYKSTPSEATGETPFFLATGTDLAIPTLQDFTPTVAPNEAAGRLELLAQARKEAFERVLRRAVERDQRAKPLQRNGELRPGDLVLRWLEPEERRRLATPLTGLAGTPYWSAPYRVENKDSTRVDAYVIKPLWEKGGTRLVLRSKLIPIPSRWKEPEFHLAVRELLADRGNPEVGRETGGDREEMQEELEEPAEQRRQRGYGERKEEALRKARRLWKEIGEPGGFEWSEAEEEHGSTGDDGEPVVEVPWYEETHSEGTEGHNTRSRARRQEAGVFLLRWPDFFTPTGGTKGEASSSPPRSH